jgi:hypothetical protein
MLPPDRDFRRARSGNRRCGSYRSSAREDNQCAGDRRQSCFGDHRISGGWQFDQALACREPAAQSGLRATLLAEGGFNGPRTVLEGQHGFYKAFAPSKAPDFKPLLEGLGDNWVLETVAFKPYACGP